MISEDVVFLYNGEIYNYNLEKKYDSDGYFVIDSYLNEGDSFIHKLDGEFALVIVDFKKAKSYFLLMCLAQSLYIKVLKKISLDSHLYMQSLKMQVSRI